MSFNKLQGFFFSGALIFYIFSTFINTFSVNIERNFVGFISGLLLRKKIPFSQQLHCVAGSDEDDTARVAEPSSEGGNQQIPREGAVFPPRFLTGVCLEADVKTKH